MSKFIEFARKNYKPGAEIDELWHPDIQAECRVMNEEAARQREADRSKIKEVVTSVDDLEKEFKGTIAFYSSFRGTITMEKGLSKDEQRRLNETLDPAMQGLIKGGKQLFGRKEDNPFPEWKKFDSARSAYATQLKAFGIPFIADATTVLKISLIPDVERLCDKIEADLGRELDELMAVYPVRLQAAQDKLGPLFNPRDYKTEARLRSSFEFKRKWMHFGVPDILKEVDMARWEAERKRTAAVWAEVKQNGLILLRKEMAATVDRLVEAVTPAPDGTKKKFYATSVTNLTDFFESFDNRNLAGDTELAGLVEKLKELVSGKDVESFKTDDKLRATIKKQGAAIQEQLAGMLVDSEARSIVFED